MGSTLQRLVGVYDADGTTLGELSYFVNARLGRAHCSLCDITHGLVRERRDWRTARAELPVEFVTFHRNDQPDAVRAATTGRLPAVVAETDAGVVMLLDRDELEECKGDPAVLVERLSRAIDDHHLS